MVTYTPDVGDVEDSSRLSSILRPRGWEHLSGPFCWYQCPKPDFFQHEEHGLSIGIRTTGRFGQIANHVNENGDFPSPVLLFSGPAGIGKSATERLFARTHLSSAENRKPVSYKVGEGKEATLVHHQTNEAFYLNPSGPEDLLGESSIKHAFEHPGDENNRRIRFYNSSDLVKDDVRRIKNWLKQDLFLEKKRILVLSEIDELSTAQSRLLKNELEAPNVKDGVLVMADTNHLAKMKKTFDKAGMQRFDHIPVGKWSVATLKQKVSDYVELFPVQFDQQRFSDLNLNPITQIAERCDGSFRQMIGFLQRILDHDGTIGPSDLDEILKIDEELNDTQSQGSGSDQTKAFWDYHRTVINGNRSVDSFAKQVVEEGNIMPFLAQLGYHIVDSKKVKVSSYSNISAPIERLFNLEQKEMGSMAGVKTILASESLEQITAEIQ